MTKVMIKKYWFTILVVSLLIIGFWIGFYSIINQPRENEKLEFFFTATTVDDDYFTEKTNEVIDIKEVTVSYCEETNTYYSVMLQTNGLITADILVVQSSLFDNTASATAFVPLTEALFSEYGLDINDYTLLSIDDVNYAVVIKNTEIDLFNGEVTYLDDDSSYAICINASSTKQDEAIKVLMNLLK